MITSFDEPLTTNKKEIRTMIRPTTSTRTPLDMRKMRDRYEQFGESWMEPDLHDLSVREDWIINVSAIEDTYLAYLVGLLEDRLEDTNDEDEIAIIKTLLKFRWTIINAIIEFSPANNPQVANK